MDMRRRIAALYDIHGNLPAVEAVLEEIRREDVDQIVVGGDVFPGPMAQEVLDCLLALEIPVQFIQGNGDREVICWRRGKETGVPEPYRESMRWVAHRLRPQDEREIARWPSTLSIEVSGLGSVLFCHATPQSDTVIFTRMTSAERLAKLFAGVDVPLVVCGHTHMQFDLTLGPVRVVNAGSVGMPFADPGAYWLRLGPDVQLRRTAYDVTKAAERIRATSYPQADEFALGNVLQPPSEEQMLQVFARAEES
jgi:putative phosphoesterase